MHRLPSGWLLLVVLFWAVVGPQAWLAAQPPEVDPIRHGPTVLVPGDHGVGRLVADAAFSDVSGAEHRLSEWRESPLVVVAQTSLTCPLSQKFLPSLAKLVEAFAEQRVAWVIVDAVATDDPRELAETRSRFPAGAPVMLVHDPQQRLAAAVGATTTTDVVVLDPSRTIVYHGAIDDQYGLGYALDSPRRRHLAEALTSLLAGRAPAITATDSPGCLLDVKSDAYGAARHTYHNRISRLVQRHCLECHRDGGVAPFPLASHAEVVAHAPMIRQVVERQVMPPWFAEAPRAGQASPWSNDRSLSSQERDDLLSWIAGGMPAGDPADAPAPREFADGWLIGEPDEVFEFAHPVPVKATGTMPYQNIVVETDVPEDKWVQAIEVRPGAREVVHHVLVFAGPAADETNPDETADERRGYWGIYVPGNSTLVYPPGYAKRLPKRARLRFQMHYTPNGTATEDVTRLGVIYADRPPEHEVRVASIVNTNLRIPPGASDHREVASLRLPADVQVLAFLPHMHLRGKRALYEVLPTEGEPRPLLHVPHYDFNWQLLYRFAEPLTLRRNETLRFTAWFDNSAANPANPDPDQLVRWGPQTFDEMHLGYVEYIVPGLPPGESPGVGERPRPGGADRPLAQVGRAALFGLLDRDRDGELTWTEAERLGERVQRFKDNPGALRTLFERLDTNQDGKLQRAEYDAGG